VFSAGSTDAEALYHFGLTKATITTINEVTNTNLTITFRHFVMTARIQGMIARP